MEVRLMAWYFDPHGDYMDVYDHEGTLVAEDEPISYDTGGDVVGVWTDYPDRVKEIAREQMEGNQPSAYNQGLLADMATDNIKKGTPP